MCDEHADGCLSFVALLLIPAFVHHYGAQMCQRSLALRRAARPRPGCGDTQGTRRVASDSRCSLSCSCGDMRLHRRTPLSGTREWNQALDVRLCWIALKYAQTFPMFDGCLHRLVSQPTLLAHAQYVGQLYPSVRLGGDVEDALTWALV
jgi:hypothetical protein